MDPRPSLFFVLFFAYACRGEKPSLSKEPEGQRPGIQDIAPAKTIMTDEGDTIDCVDVYEQPAFGHPAMKCHTVLWMPSTLLSRDIDRANNVSYKLADPCPPGTVAIPRVRKVDLIMDRTLPRVSGNRNCDVSDLNQVVEFSRIFWSDGADPFEHGGGAVLNTHNLSVAIDRFASLNLVVHGGRLSAISAGWIVDQRGLTRFFTYWTGDNYNDGCYNLDCPGFVQTSSEIAIDAVVSYKGDRFGVQVIVSQDPLTRHWWLAYDGDFVGYWPNELFRHLHNVLERTAGDRAETWKQGKLGMVLLSCV